ncbi:RNHCP domain-containing protein [Streptomyces sp. NPDC048638]|uniref:RNHCP domain-containing protein n=1 Tax=Streptomyces sp. NPDC048638 TaxID=3365580 RepID=UPI00371A35CB
MDTYRRHVEHPRDSDWDKQANPVVVRIQSGKRTLVKLEPEVIATHNGGEPRHSPVKPAAPVLAGGERTEPCASDAVERHSAKGYMIVHQCTGCGTRGRNRMADDPHQGDELDAVLALMRFSHHEAGHTNRRRTHV